jgi:4,5-dihydroxyphthalate decarboxylase
MSRPSLRTVTRTQGANAALKDGTVAPRGFDLAFEDVPVLIHAFRRMVREQAYDVCEMAFTTYLCAKAVGKRFTALPVFLMRGFHHGAILTAANGGIEDPKGLAGRAAGVNLGYTVTTGVWARGVLHDEYGVEPSRVTWVRSGDEHVAEYRPPENVVSMRPGGDLADMVLSGELAAAIGINPGHPGLTPLIPNATEAGFAALRERGHYPINHLIVVRDELLCEYPDLARSVFDAFTEAKHRYLDQLRAGTLPDPTAADATYRRVMEITGADPLPYGVAPNEAVIEELIRHTMDQGILDRRPDIGSLFAWAG